MRGLTRPRWIALAAVALVVWASAAYAQDADPRLQKFKEEFARGLRAFEAGKYEEAAAAFEKVLAQSPSSTDALVLRDLADVRFFIQAMRKGTPKMRASLLRLLDLAEAAEKRRLTDRAEIKKVIGRLLGSFEVRTKAYIDLVSAGRYAVPELLKVLTDTSSPDYATFRVRATIALIRIGEEAVLPLCTALRSDHRGLRQDICAILGQIGDPRSVPYLLRAASPKLEPSSTVREVAEWALKELGKQVAVPDEPPHVALLRHARLYYYGAPSVERPSRYGHAVWNWSVEDGELVMQDVPGFLYDVSMARKVASEALLAMPDSEPVLPLLISAYQKERLLIRRRFELSQSDPEQKLAEVEQQQLQARVAKCENVLLTLRSAGEKHFYRALRMQLRDRSPELATAVIEDLAVIARPELNVYRELPELAEPLRPAVYKAPERPARAGVTTAAGTKPAEPAAATRDARRATTNAMRLFGVAVEKEKERVEAAVKAAEAKERRTIGKASPKELDELTRLIAAASRIALERRRAVAAEAGGPTEVVRLESSPLLQALKNPDKGVRYAAAGALVHTEPVREFEGSLAVVKILGQAVIEKGVSTVLVVSSDSQAMNRLLDLVREAGHLAYGAASDQAALGEARSKDLVLLDEKMKTAFVALKKDPAVTGVPVVVFVRGSDVSAAAAEYGNRASAIVSLKEKPDKLKSEMARVILGRRTQGEMGKLSAGYALRGARAVDAIPAAGSPYSRHLVKIKPELVRALESDEPAVRISAIRALGRARVTALIPRLIVICQSEDRPEQERRACIEALGDMVGPKEAAPPELIALLKRIHRSGNAALRRFAVRRLSRVVIPPADIEKLVNQEEASQAAPPKAPE